MSEPMRSKFASPERDDPETVHRAGKAVLNHALFISTMDAVPDVVMILNKHRQIVYCNKALFEALGAGKNDIIGKRPGEAFKCIHAAEEPAGCGTSAFCSECGAVKAILAAQSGEKSCQECRLNSRADDKERVFDLRVWATPMSVDGEDYVIFAIKDIADEKRKEVLQRTFFHDVLNEATILLLYADDITASAEGDPLSAQKVRATARMIANNIEAQRELLFAEQGTLSLDMKSFPVREFLQGLIDLHGGMKYASGRTIRLECPAPGPMITSDRTILGRVIGNLIKNALEATAKGATVTVRYATTASGGHLFQVTNPEVMPENVRLQIFQRSFSTKGPGRGIGTHSVKLLTETYLKGRASFSSREGAGTAFFIELPG